MSAIYASFIAIIVLIVHECVCEWRGDFDDGKKSVYSLSRPMLTSLVVPMANLPSYFRKFCFNTGLEFNVYECLLPVEKLLSETSVN